MTARHYVLRRLRDAIARATRGCGVEGGVVLDYGCGDAPYRSLFPSSRFRYVGADFAGNQSVDVIVRDSEPIPFASDACDIVLSTQVLEHVSDPAQYLGECRRVLRERGYLVLSTHGIWPYHPHPADLWRWTSEGLKRQLERSGFVVESLEGILGLASTGIQLVQDAVEYRVPSRLRPIYYGIMQTMIEVSDWMFPHPIRGTADSAVFVTRARKR
jgi:SAM-dependent methyltransferase